MTSSVTNVQRPVLVTVVPVLIVLSGVSNVLSGVLALGIGGTTAIAAGVFLIVVGIVYFAVAKGLLNGNPTVRLVVAVVTVVQALLSILLLTGSDQGSLQSSAIRSLAFAVITLAILYSPSANALFGTRR